MAALGYRVLLLSVCLPLFSWQSGEYLREALQGWSRFSTTEQQDILDLSSQLGDGIFSDYWFARQELLPSRQAMEKIAALEQAVKLNRWLVFRPGPSVEELARLLLRYQQYQRLWELYLSWPAEWRDYGQIGVYAAQALSRLGRTGDAVALAKAGLRRHPDQLDYFRVLAAEGWTGRLYRHLTRALDGAKPTDPNLMRSLIEQTNDPEWREALAHLYGQYWPNDAYLALTLADLYPTELGKRLTFIRDNYEVNDFLLADRWYRRSTGYLNEKQRRAWLQGWFNLDRNYDGVIEERLYFVAGDLRQRNIFFYNSQNWVLQLHFLPGGELERMELTGRKDGVSWAQRARYFRYPMVETLELERKGQRIVYHYDPVRFTLPLSEQPLRDEGDWSRIPLKLPAIKLEGLRKNSFRVEFYQRVNAADVLVKVIDMAADGQPAELREDLDLDGHFEQITVPYEWQGKPSWIGFARRKDQDGDGFFETKEIHLQGKPLLYMVDLDKDLTADYTETLTNGGSRTWSQD